MSVRHASSLSPGPGTGGLGKHACDEVWEGALDHVLLSRGLVIRQRQSQEAGKQFGKQMNQVFAEPLRPTSVVPAPNYSGFQPADARALTEAVAYVIGSGVHGDIAEFGCFAGRTAQILARALNEIGIALSANDRCHGIAARKLWLFDSFEGFPAVEGSSVDGRSPHVQANVWQAGEPSGSSPEHVREMCSRFLPADRVRIKQGWFKHTLREIPSGIKFGLVHLDCDYYESTRDVLLHLIDNDMFADGCTLLFDDWYCNRGSPRFGQQRAWSEVEGRFWRFTNWGPYGTVGRRFIVHHDGGAGS